MRATLESYLPAATALLAVALGVWLRLSALPSLFLYGDEYHSLPLARSDYLEILRSFDFFGSGIALPLLQKAAADAFGGGLLSVRLSAVLTGGLTLVVFYPLAKRWIGRSAAALATLALSLSPIHVFYSHFGRSYALVVLLALGLAGAVSRVTTPSRASPAWYGMLALCTALLPYVHLSALGITGAIALGGALRAIRQGRPRQLAGLGAAFALGGALCLALYLPAWGPLAQFVGAHRGKAVADIAPLALATVLAGNVGAALTMLVGCPLAAFLLIRLRSEAGWLLAAAALLPAGFLLLLSPVGGVYAHARYLIAALPFLLMLLSWGFVEALRSARPARLASGRRVIEIGLGSALILASTAFGPLSPATPDPGQYANTYLGLHHESVFDVPFEATPAFYADLTGSPESSGIIEAPALTGRAMLLYRNYFLQHGQQTWLGVPGSGTAGELTGPFLALSDEPGLRSSGARYLVLHLDVADELRRYLSAVADLASARGRDSDDPFLEPLLAASPLRALAPSQLRRLRTTLGDPVFAANGILVWELQ